jgi:hypothetical protein
MIILSFFLDARRGDAALLAGSAALTGDRLRAETEAVPAAEVERKRRQAVCDTKHVGALRTSMG